MGIYRICYSALAIRITLIAHQFITITCVVSESIFSMGHLVKVQLNTTGFSINNLGLTQTP